MRYFIELSYKGTNYHGWQIQENAESVQAVLNQVLATLLRQPVETVGSGRTDTGVHATQQFAHFDMDNPILNLPALVYQINALLPADVAVREIFPVADTIHSRFDAISRSYEYRIHTQKSPFLKDLSYFFPHPLDIEKLNQAAGKLLGERDFASFSKVHTNVNNFFCTVSEAFWEKKDEGLIFHISANRFLRGMVRAIVGTLLEVGRNKMQIVDFEEIIHKKDRKAAGRNAPPEGLFLTKVEYPFL